MNRRPAARNAPVVAAIAPEAVRTAYTSATAKPPDTAPAAAVAGAASGGCLQTLSPAVALCSAWATFATTLVFSPLVEPRGPHMPCERPLGWLGWRSAACAGHRGPLSDACPVCFEALGAVPLEVV